MTAKCLVSQATYQQFKLSFTAQRIVTTGLHGLSGPVIGKIEPAYEEAPTVCVYCCAQPVDQKHEPYCSSICGINAQGD